MPRGGNVATGQLFERERARRKRACERIQWTIISIYLVIYSLYFPWLKKKKKENPCEEVGLSIFIYQWLKTP